MFSPDGSKLVTPTTDGTGSIVWSTTSRRRLAVLDHGNGILLGAAISPSGRWLAVPAIYEKPRFESRLQVWDLARNRLVRLIHSPAGGLTSAAFSADGDTLITQGGPRLSGRFGTEVVLWNTRTWRPRGDPLLVNPEYSGDRTVAVSADGGLLAVPRSSGDVRVWSSSARKPVATLPATTAPVTALAFAPDASALAIGDDGGGVRFLDPRTGKSKAKPLALSESSPVAIEYSPEGSRVAVGRQDGRTQIFELRVGRAAGATPGSERIRHQRCLVQRGWKPAGDRRPGPHRSAVAARRESSDRDRLPRPERRDHRGGVHARWKRGCDGRSRRVGRRQGAGDRVDHAPVPARRRGALGRGLARRLDAGGRRHRRARCAVADR